ncbi:MAG: glycosyltransferase [Candidatus Marinimicrobia bacterium]|nr:glycosyltransferase [Candidatus Neomarinimicrobiota bacterium]
MKKTLFKTLSGNIERKFVKHPFGQSEGTIEIHRELNITSPIISIVIPTINATRDGYLPDLLKQIKQQTFQNYEIILITSDSRQGRAINCGVQIASGKYIMTFDDDIKIGRDDLLEKMLFHIKRHSDIGMAGVANIIPENASFFIRRSMKELPRRTSPVVSKIVDSDMAEHPCCIIPRDIFIQVGGENEKIPRGLDPYLKQEIRKAGYRVVVLPELLI